MSLKQKIERNIDLLACKNGKNHIWKNKTIGYDSDVCLICGHTKKGIQWLRQIRKQTDAFYSEILKRECLE